MPYNFMVALGYMFEAISDLAHVRVCGKQTEHGSYMGTATMGIL